MMQLLAASRQEWIEDLLSRHESALLRYAQQ